MVTDYRVTLGFTADSGNRYLYDDATGMTFAWSDLREKVLSSLLAGDLETSRREWSYSAAEVDGEAKRIDGWRRRYGAFVRQVGPYADVPEPAELEAWIRKEILMQLILVVTEDCNLRCRYCAYSDYYPLNRSRTARGMSLELAREAVDYYFELARPERSRNPRRLFGVTFYGGEPLLKADLIEKVLAHVAERYPGLTISVMTTNGLLLNERVTDMLVRHDVHISVSLDGPRPEHDRNRVFPSGEGSYEPMMRNLRRIRKERPEFFTKNVTAVCVYDTKTDVEEADGFFLSSADPVPPALFVSKVATRNTSYYESIGEDELARHAAQVTRLREEFKRRVVAGEKYSSYSQSFVGFPIATCLLRSRLANVRPPFLPFTGACIPGTKVCVQVDGRIDICERVNGTFPVGHMKDGGIDFGRVKRVIEDYRRAVCDACFRCPVTKMCSMCFSTTERDGSFEKTPADCAEMVAMVRKSLADYYSIKERNPRADFSYETDQTYLERRLMFL